MKRLSVPLTISGFMFSLIVFFSLSPAQALLSPTLTAITPNTGATDQQTAVTIIGQGFSPTSTLHLDAAPLLDVTFVDSATLRARVPFGLPTGVYTLTATTPETVTLTNAFTITEGTLGWASGGPYGGRTRGIAIHPTVTETVYVSAEQSGLYRTTNGGERWDQVAYSNASVGGLVAVWPVDPDVVFFGGSDGLYRSTQGGDAGSWALMEFNGESLGQPNALEIAPSTPYTLYCSIGNTLFHSADGGTTWDERNTGLPGSPWRLAVDPDDAATVYAGFQDGTLYKTTNAGQTWSTLPYSIPLTSEGEGGVWALTADPYRDATLWVGTWKQGLHRSTDGGQTFEEVASFYTVGHQSGFWAITFDPNQDRILVGVSGPNDSLYYSDDGGDSWSGLGLNNQGGADIAVTPGDSDTLYTTWSGVRKSTDGGQSWRWLSEGISAIQPVRVTVSPHDPQKVLTVADADGAFGTHNNGNQWVTYPISRGGESHQYQAAAFDPISPTVAYIGGTETVFKTTDDGQTWQATANMPLPGYDGARPLFIAIHPQTSTLLYAGVSFFNMNADTVNAGALYQSSDEGDSWTEVTATGPISPVNRVVLAPSAPQIIYLGTGAECHWCGGNGIWRSLDGGQTWERPDTLLNNYRVRALAVHPNNPAILLAGVWIEANDGLGIYRSTDSGDSWEPTSGLTEQEEQRVPDIAYDPANPQIVYAATHGGLRISFDGGVSWSAYPGPIGSLPITALAVSQDGEMAHLYLATVGGTTVGATSDFQTAQTNAIMGAGVYIGRSHWHTLYIPLVLRD